MHNNNNKMYTYLYNYVIKVLRAIAAVDAFHCFDKHCGAARAMYMRHLLVIYFHRITVYTRYYAVHITHYTYIRTLTKYRCVRQYNVIYL